MTLIEEMTKLFTGDLEESPDLHSVDVKLYADLFRDALKTLSRVITGKRISRFNRWTGAINKYHLESQTQDE